MRKFALKKIEAVVGKQEFFELIIDGVSQLDNFYEDLQDRYKTEYDTILTYMDYVAKCQTNPPPTKFKDITPKKEKVKEYEFKSKHLRVYGIAKENGKIIILMGFKTTQDRDIKKFRNLKREYLESK
jgi:hypothetical protein